MVSLRPPACPRVFRHASLFLLAFCQAALGQPVASDEQFCAAAQQLLVNTKLQATNIVHTDFDAFVKAKPSARPLTTHQFVRHDAEGRAKTVSCKMKTSQEIQQQYGQGSAGEERSCKQLIEFTLGELRVEYSASLENDVALDVALIVDEDDTAWMGPSWIRPWPYSAARVDEQQRVHLRAKAMRIPASFWIPMPARFKGTYYCHLPAPEHILELLAGGTL